MNDFFDEIDVDLQHADELYQQRLEDERADAELRAAMGEKEWARFCAEVDAHLELSVLRLSGGKVK